MLDEYAKARDELVDWFGPNSKYASNEAWLDRHVRSVVMWRTARKVCLVPPAGKDNLIEYWKFVNTLDMVNHYQSFMSLVDER